MVSADALQSMVKHLARAMKPEKIILFGSYARGEAGPDSDVDLLIVADTNLPPRQRFSAARRLLADYLVPFDLIVQTPAEYQQRRALLNDIVYFADKYGKVVYERKSPRRRTVAG